MRIFIGIAIVAAACTGSINSGAGGGGGDDDGTTPPPPPANSVQVIVQDGTAPQAGVDVLFQNTDGSVVLETMTDATGAATATMTAGNVTVARTFPAGSAGGTQREPEIYTYVGVAAGDRLVLGDPTDDTGVPAAINVTVPNGTQGTVNITSACGSGQGTAPIVAMTVAACPASVMFFVVDSQQDSAVLTAPYSSNVDLSTDDLEGTLSTTFSSTDLTPDMTQVNVATYVMDGTHELYTSGNKRVDTTPQTVNLPNLSGVDELVVATITSTEGTQMVSSRQMYAATPETVDASANLLPYVSTPTYKPTGVTWTETGTGTPDFIVAALTVTPHSSVAKYTRYIIAPYASMTLAIPTLAGTDTTYNPGTMDNVTGTMGLGAVTGGYAAARPFAFRTPKTVDGAPMGGTITLSYAGNTAPAL